MMQELELFQDVLSTIQIHCDKFGIEFMSTAFDLVSADLQVDLDIRFIKIPSGEITILPLISYLAEKHLPVIMSAEMTILEMGNIECGQNN